MSWPYSDTVELLGRRNIQKRRRQGNLRSLRLSGEDMAMHGTSPAPEGRELSDSHSYLSDRSLPSERARFAASNRYQELRRGGRRQVKESTPLLALERDSAIDDSSETGRPVQVRVDGKAAAISSPSSGYDSLPASEGKGWALGRWPRGYRARLLQGYKTTKIFLLTCFMTTCVILFAVRGEEETSFIIVRTGTSTQPEYIHYNHTDHWDHVVLSIRGPFTDESFLNKSGQHCKEFLFLCGPGGNHTNCTTTEDSSNCQSVRLSSHASDDIPTIETSSVISRTLQSSKSGDFHVSFTSSQRLMFEVSTKGELISNTVQVALATIILVGVYSLIIFDIVHRTMAAFIGSTATLATLSMLEKRPTLEGVVDWIDLDTICLLFGMMTLVAIFSQTGFFDYSAVKAYKLAKGKIWPLITILCLLSAVVSAFLDNVTTILLLTPVSIRLCQVLNLDPRPVLIAEVVFSNIGGTATAVGDPPNVIIVSNDLIQDSNIDFPEFTLHLSLGILICMVVAYALLACIYCSYVRLRNKDPPHIAELKREIAIWERTAAQMPVISLEETAVRDALRAKANEVRNQLQQEVNMSMQSAQDLWQKHLTELEQQYRITNRVLLVKSSAVLVVVILLFFLANTIPNVELELGWVAIFGAVVLLILADTQELEPVLHKIEWSTLLFFAGLFVLMEGLAELGLIKFIGNVMVELIQKVPPKEQMLVALVLIVWVSALSSSFIDNIPFTTATIPVIVELAESPEVCLSLRPLVWALAFGACLGGNGTLIGASANVVCAGIAEQNGYKISFVKFFVIGFPMMLATTFTAMVYLLICHVAIKWDAPSC